MAISGLSAHQIIRYKDLTLGGNYSYNGMTQVISDKMLVTSSMFTIASGDGPAPIITSYIYNVSVEIDGDIYVLIPRSDYTGANNHAFFVPYTVADSMAGSMDIEVGMEPYNDWFVRFCSVVYPYALNGSDEYTFSNCSNLTNVYYLRCSSPTIGINLLTIGSTTFLPINLLYLSSFGLTATAVSPNNVSGLVVATSK